ncbi:hypothetical protein R6G69_05030 [Actinotignum urinale]|uniref:hypothetical protein n=1 Tax=Actinotignum urinale TaxID=190146 RepID=UPI002A7FC895|nr:hypothetical protein [Actinotignum urinale]MDY5129356.1 hypothetical protein [Actinotignum urinale]
MSTPQNPYNSGQPQRFDDEEILEPIGEDLLEQQETVAYPTSGATPSADFSDTQTSQLPPLPIDDLDRQSSASSEWRSATSSFDAEAPSATRPFVVAGTNPAGTNPAGTTVEETLSGASTDSGVNLPAIDGHAAPTDSAIPSSASAPRPPKTGGSTPGVDPRSLNAQTTSEQNDFPVRTSITNGFSDTNIDYSYGVDEPTANREYVNLAQAAGVAVTPPEIETPPAQESKPVSKARRAEIDSAPVAKPLTPDVAARWAEYSDGEAIPAAPKKRLWTHLWVTLVTLLLTPLTWYVLSDSIARFEISRPSALEAASVNYAAVFELLGGVALVILIALLARRSTLGTQMWGWCIMLGGIFFLIFPKIGVKISTALSGLEGPTSTINTTTENFVHHFSRDISFGGFVIFGAMLLAIGFAAHGARRRGETRATAQTARALTGTDD